MDQDSVRARLAQLHGELQAAHQENPATRESLNGVLPDIQKLIETPASQDASLTGRLEGIAVRFEAEHPTVGGSVRRLIELLNEVGI